MERLWSLKSQYQSWLRVEMSAVRAWHEHGLLPDEDLWEIEEHAHVNLPRILEIEAETHHDLAAFVKSLEEQVPSKAGRWIHYGLTSSDVVDTALCLRIREALVLLRRGLRHLGGAISVRAREHRDTPMIGRSHGIHAEPTTFGLVMAVWYSEIQRHLVRLEASIKTISVGQLSGAVGTFSHVPPEVEETALGYLDLTPVDISSQIIQRDRHAEVMSCLGLIASSIEKFAIQIRHWQRTEVGEVSEKFKSGQQGSSAMPHKKNPILSENLTGLARMIRGYVYPAMESVALWHERDMSHSSVERIAIPDATSLLDFALHRLARVVEEMEVHPEVMLENLNSTKGLPYSQGVLLTLVQKGLTRQEAYGLVQGLALKAYEDGLDFQAIVCDDPAILNVLTKEEALDCFSLSKALRYVPEIFDRVFS